MSKPQQNKVQAEIMQAYRDVFLHTPQGEIIFKDMLKVSGLYQITILALDENQITKLAIGEPINAE